MKPELLGNLYAKCHNLMRNKEGLQPQEALDELLKYLFFKQSSERVGDEVGVQRSLAASGDFSHVDPKAVRAIRNNFKKYLKKAEGGIRAMWPNAQILLSDETLHAVHELFSGVSLSATSSDIRSAALRLFISAEIRKGSGIFLTPDEVVKCIVKIVDPSPAAVVFDPACGSGTFLIETLKHWKHEKTSWEECRKIYGSDINSRMLLLAQLNLCDLDNVLFENKTLDALETSKADRGAWPKPNSFDIILANPPFGVYVNSTDESSSGSSKTPSEMVFTLNCLKWLKPGGILGIIVPKSVISNKSLSQARRAIDELGELQAILNLPPETFASTGTQTNTSVLFIKKRLKSASSTDEIRSVPILDVDNVGVDSTGRPRAGSELDSAAFDLKSSIKSGLPHGKIRLIEVSARHSLDSISSTGPAPKGKNEVRLGDLLDLAQTGRTPARSAYVPKGVFTVKVGNLTGQGIDWAPRERNFADPEKVSEKLLLEEGDILLTSSAHNPRYIAQKVDIVYSIPPWLNGEATFTGEVLRLRARKGSITAFELLALMRQPDVKKTIRELIRGQTAHLRPDDLVGISVNVSLIDKEMVKLLKQEAELYKQLNIVAHKQSAIATQDPGQG